MYKSSILFLIALLAEMCNAHAQEFTMYKSDKIDHIGMFSGYIKDSVQLDVSRLSIRYRFTNKSIKINSEDAFCELLMQVGDHVIKQIDLCKYYDNLMYTKRETRGALSDSRSAVASYPSNLFVELFCNQETDELSIVCGDYFKLDAMRTYSEPKPVINWTLIDESQTIIGYLCQKAKAQFRGRNWTVWYTSQIPVSTGPWKLSGLPGLILKATDGDAFCFDCVELQNNELPIFKYIYRSIQDVKTRQNYLRYERNCHEHPYEVSANGKQATIMLAKSNGEIEYLDHTWTIPYNPIELE